MSEAGLFDGAEDAVRYEREIAAFEQQHPSFVSQRRQKKAAKVATKPRRCITAFQAFLKEQLSSRPADESAKPQVWPIVLRLGQHCHHEA